MNDALPPGSTIGILGGGQLGRMLSVAAARLGLTSHILEPGANPPAGHVADRVTTADYDDQSAVRAFAESVDVVTYEFENVPAGALDLIGSTAPIRPGRLALATSQDRLVEKEFVAGLGLGVAPYMAVDDVDSLEAAVEALGTPAILKTRRFGYDGKGQILLAGPAEFEAAIDAIGKAPAILERFVPFELEISVIAARSTAGDVAAYDPGHNTHADGILRTTEVPAPITETIRAAAIEAATELANALDYVGVLGVEFFVTDQGLIVNEFAPRVHNSGHWTQNGCVVDQFEQHIRAVAGWPLGDSGRHSDVTMQNLIGADIENVAAIASEPDVGIHLYGKAEARPGRKMGHVNRLHRAERRWL